MGVPGPEQKKKQRPLPTVIALDSSLVNASQRFGGVRPLPVERPWNQRHENGNDEPSRMESVDAKQSTGER